MRRVVFDPNVLVSAYISPHGVPAQLYTLWADRRFQLVVSRWLLDELRRVLTHAPRLARYRDDAAIATVLGTLEARAEMQPDPASVPPVTRDPTDDYLIALAQASGAECIVSGDRDLTDQADLKPPAMSPRAFLDLLIADGVASGRTGRSDQPEAGNP